MNFIEKFEKVKELIRENATYFEEFEDEYDLDTIADKFINNYSEGQPLPYANTPPTWLNVDMGEILDDESELMGE